MDKLVLFIDLDNTLIQTVSGKTFPEDVTDFRISLPILSKIIEKLPTIRYFFIITNQGGVGKYFTKEDIEVKLNTIFFFCYDYLSAHGLKLIYGNYRYCSSIDKNDSFRKPNTGMLEYEYEHYLTKYSKEQMLMIGDASGKEGDYSNSDKKCAENFGIDYVDVRDFLKNE